MNLTKLFSYLKEKIYFQKTSPEKLALKILNNISLLGNIKPDIANKLLGSTIKLYPAKEIIFKKGDQGNDAYFILSGEVNIHLDHDAKPITLTSGQMFGELALLKKQPRAGTAITKSEAKILIIDHHSFFELHKASPEFQKYTDTLEHMYRIPNRGLVTISQDVFAEMDVLKMVFQLETGETVVASNVVGKNIFFMSNTNVIPDKILFYKEDKWHSRRLLLKEHRLIGIINIGPWNELDKACGILLDSIPLKDEQIFQFEQNGNLNFDAVKNLPAEIVCYCMNVSKKSICELIPNHSLEEISEKTGATTICGGCRIEIMNLIKKFSR